MQYMHITIWQEFKKCKPEINDRSNKFALKLRSRAPANLIVSGLPNQSAITCSKLTVETLEKGVKYVQS